MYLRCLRRKKCPSCFKGIYCFVKFLFHFIWTWSYMHLSIVNGSPKALKPLLRVYEWYACVSAQSLQSYPTLRDPMDCSPLGSSVHGIIQARILEWVVISYFRGSSRPGIRVRDQTHVFCVSCIDRWILYHWEAWEAYTENRWMQIGQKSMVNFFLVNVTQWSG